MEIYGNTSGLAPSETKALERIYQRRLPFDKLTTTELTRDLVSISHATGRQVGVLGLIGPLRMAYQQVIPMVSAAAQLLSTSLNR